jgi:uncharacterized membrane protein YbhN (UPF0104 family)
MNTLRERTLFRNLLAYALAAAIIWYLTRDVPIRAIVASCARANLPLFIGASAFSFILWFVGETFLFSCLFSYVHKPTGFRELAPANAANYFLQLINMAVAGGALVLFLHRRKHVHWLAAGWTLLFEGLIDGCVISVMTIAASLIYPHSPIHAGLWYAVGALAAFTAINAFWMRGTAMSSTGRWILARPSMEAFRNARPVHYAKLFAVRTMIFTLAGVALYLQMIAFGVKAPFGEVMAFNPAVILLGGLPLTPVGMGPLQAVVVSGFGSFGSKSQLLAMSLAVSGMSIAFRAPLGLTTAGLFARDVAEVSRTHGEITTPVPLQSS